MIKNQHKTYHREFNEENGTEIAPRLKLFVPEILDQEKQQRLHQTLQRNTLKKGGNKATNPDAAFSELQNYTDLKGKWLSDDMSLGSYGLKDDDRICLFDTQRVLVFQLEGDQGFKNITVDESQSVQELVYQCCMHSKINCKPLNHTAQAKHNEDKVESREYLLSRSSNIQNIHGVIEDKKNIDVTFWFLESTAGTHEKKFRKGMKTDQDIIWLKAEETLRGQGVADTEQLILRRRYYGFRDNSESANSATLRNVQINEAALQLTYASCQRNVTSGAQIVKKEEAIQLAAFQILAESKNIKVPITKEQINLIDVLPPEMSGKKNYRKTILEEVKKIQNNPVTNQAWAKRQYLSICKMMKSYGYTFFMVRARPNIRVHRLDAMLFGISKDGVILVSAETRLAIGPTLPLLNISAWSLSDSCFLIEFDDAQDSDEMGIPGKTMEELKHPCIERRDNRLSLRTVDGEQIQQLLAGYIDLKKQMIKERQMIITHVENVVHVEPPKPKKGEKMKKFFKSQKNKWGDGPTDEGNEEEMTNRLIDMCNGKLGVERLIGVEFEDNVDGFEQYERDTDEFNRKIRALAHIWNTQGDKRSGALTKSAKDLMDALNKLILGQKRMTGDEFENVLELLQTKDTDNMDMLALFAKLNINDKVKRRNLFDAVKNLLDALNNLIKGANTVEEMHQQVGTFLAHAEQEGIDTSYGLPYRMKVMQEAREEVINPTLVENINPDFNDSAEQLQESMNFTLINLIEIAAQGGVVDDRLLDDMAGQCSDLVQRIQAYGTKNLDDATNRHLKQALSELLQQLSKLLESADNRADNLSLPDTVAAMNEVRRVFPTVAESEHSKQLKAFLQQSVYDVQMRVPQMVQTSIQAAQQEQVDQNTMQNVMSPAVGMVQKTKRLGQVNNALCSLPELKVTDCDSVKTTANHIKDNSGQFANKMKNVLGNDNFDRYNLRNAANGVSNALNELLLGLKFFDNEAYQNMLKALAKVHNPQEKEELVGDDFEDYKADIITKVVEVLGIVPNLESSNDSSNSTHQIAKTTLSSAEYLSHLLTTEPNHQQVSIEYVKEVAAVVLKSLQGAHINDDDIYNLTTAVNNLFASLHLNQRGDLQNQLLLAAERVVRECQILEQQGMQVQNDELTESCVGALMEARKLAFMIKLKAPVCEHIDFGKEVGGMITEVRAHKDEAVVKAPEVLESQGGQVEEALRELEEIISNLPKSTAIGMRDAEIALAGFEEEMINLKEEVNEEQSDEELNEAKQYEVGLIDDALGIISSSKDLVSASAALQSEADRKNGIVAGEFREEYTKDSDFNEGLVSAALEVVKAIGALKSAVADTVQGDISKEYLIVCAQHVKEKCVALEVASAVINVGVHSKNYGRIKTASNRIKNLTDDMARKAQEATHFSEAATELKYKIRGGYTTELFYDKTGQYKFTDLLKLREVINQKKKLLEVLPQKIRDLRRQQKGTQLGHIHEKNRRKRATAEEIQELQSGANIQEALAGGLKTWVQQELHLKEQIMQAQTILDKAMAKHEAIEKINPEKLEDSD